MIYADVDGNIGWIASGLMPRRQWSGLLPVPGDGRFEWNGFVPTPQLPQSYNPPSGFIATANNNILPPGYKTPIAFDWSSDYRVSRIREVLSSRSNFTIADFQALQHDDLSLLARRLVPSLISAARRLGKADTRAVQMLGHREQVAECLITPHPGIADNHRRPRAPDDRRADIDRASDRAHVARGIERRADLVMNDRCADRAQQLEHRR